VSLWSVRNFIVEAERWVDVRDWARAKFQDDSIEVVACESGSPHFTLRWVGHDAGARPNMHLEVIEHHQ
jgi:hypothetical protein